jgi:hypothetical protein
VEGVHVLVPVYWYVEYNSIEKESVALIEVLIVTPQTKQCDYDFTKGCIIDQLLWQYVKWCVLIMVARYNGALYICGSNWY